MKIKFNTILVIITIILIVVLLLGIAFFIQNDKNSNSTISRDEENNNSVISKDKENNNSNLSTNNISDSILWKSDWSLSVGDSILTWSNKLQMVEYYPFNSSRTVSTIFTYDYNGRNIEFCGIGYDSHTKSEEEVTFSSDSYLYKGWHVTSKDNTFNAIKFYSGHNFAYIESNKNTPTDIDGKEVVQGIIDNIYEKKSNYNSTGLIPVFDIDLLGNGKLYISKDGKAFGGIMYKSKTNSLINLTLSKEINFGLFASDSIWVNEFYSNNGEDIKDLVNTFIENDWKENGKVSYKGVNADVYITKNNSNSNAFQYVIYSDHNTALIVKYYKTMPKEINTATSEKTFQILIDEFFKTNNS